MPLAIDLTGRTILVCGVARGGIGGATARGLARAGARVVALDKEQALVNETLADIADAGGRAVGTVADLMDRASCEAIVGRVWDEHGAIDGIANVAGGTREGEWMPLDVTPTDSFWQTLQLNFAYIFPLCRDLAARWIEDGRKGSIVNVSSVSSLTSAPWHGPYGAAKSAITALTRTMAQEWKDFGIRANSVLPGAVATQRVIDRVLGENGRELGPHFVETDELANAVAFLMSDLASGISGQSLLVDRALATKFCAGATTLTRDDYFAQNPKG